MKIGIFGGSFNPPHKMHEKIAYYLLEKYLDKIIFVPTGMKYSYKNNLIASDLRYKMLKLITDKNPNLEVSDYELKKHMVYTYETLDYFKEKYSKDEIFFICGADNLSYLDTWKNGFYLLENYKFLVVKRESDDIDEILRKLSDYKENITVVDMELNSLSSSIIREKLKQNISIEETIDKDVYRFILKNNLYRK